MRIMPSSVKLAFEAVKKFGITPCDTEWIVCEPGDESTHFDDCVSQCCALTAMYIREHEDRFIKEWTSTRDGMKIRKLAIDESQVDDWACETFGFPRYNAFLAGFELSPLSPSSKLDPESYQDGVEARCLVFS